MNLKLVSFHSCLSYLTLTSSMYRSTLVKERVGCSKPSSRILPPSDFVYGIKSTKFNQSDSFEEGIKNWGKLISYEKSYNKSYKPRILPSDVTKLNSERANSVHGRKSETHTEKMKDIVSGSFTNYQAYEAIYPIIPKHKKIITFPVPKATLASQLAQLERLRKEKTVAPVSK